MSTNSLNEGGHVFQPALQGISLKRFRMRYCAYSDCYYLHWDNPVCPPLAKIYGLMNGAYCSTGIQRYRDDSDGQVYLSYEKGAPEARIEWVIDFSCCGLVIHQLEVRSRYGGDEGTDVTFSVRGDECVYITPDLGDHYTKLTPLTGCSRVSIAAQLDTSSNEPIQLLNSWQGDEPALDIIVDLMCPRRDDEIYAGELLLGLKFTSEDQCSTRDEESICSTSDNGSNDVSIDNEEKTGQLQVHVVEGAGIVDELTHRPFKTFVKCDLLPDIGRFSSKQTSPKHNAYPTWAKEFFYNGLTKHDIINGGLEVILYDHHKFASDSNIGGLRICLPKKRVQHELIRNDSSDSSSFGSRGASPVPAELSPNGDSPRHSDGAVSPLSHFQITEADLIGRLDPQPSNTIPRLQKHHSLPNSRSLQTVSSSTSRLSPEVARRAPSPDVHARYSSPNTLSPNVIRRSPKNSPISNAKNFFRMSGSHFINALSPSSSPRASPILGRRKLFSRNNSIESEYVYWWMENTPQRETLHWKQVLEKDGEWVYFWHVIRPKMKSAY